jgi:type IX secretion system PorP/SprF family membrane protein
MKLKHLLTLTLLIAISSTSTNLLAQDLHFARVEDLAIWYNPSLKNSKQSDVRLNFRDVRYQNMVSYRSGAVFSNVTLSSNGKEQMDNSGYLSMSVGLANDQSNQNILRNTSGVLGLSYAVPITGQNQYLAVSIQGSYVNSRLDLSNATFPDQFDRNGPINGATTIDPLGVGTPRDWFSSHLGVSMFEIGQDQSWSLGVAVRDITSPRIERGTSQEFTLAPTFGVQGSYEMIKGTTRYGISGVANFKAEAFEQLLSTSVSHHSKDSKLSSIRGGVAYRVRDAVIPFAEIGIGTNTIGLYYELNVSGIQAAGYSRNAFELSLRKSFKSKKKAVITKEE